jgi:hypothetical protein
MVPRNDLGAGLVSGDMKTLSRLSVLVFVVAIAACATVPKQTLRASDETPRRPPGARCDFDDQCASGICDEVACRGPAPERELTDDYGRLGGM